MKKFFSFITAFVIMIIGITPVYAANYIAGTSNANEILESDKDLIISVSQEWLNEKTGLPIDEKTFAYDRAKCVYYGVDLFKNDYLNNELMQKYIEDENVYALYELPAYFDDSTLVINLVKGYEISDEDFEKLSDSEKEYFNSIDGRWHAQSHYVKNEHYDYISHIEELLEELDINDANVYIAGGPTKALSILAVICQGDENAEFLILENNEYSDNKLYSFEEIKQLAEETKDTADDNNMIVGLNSENNNEIHQGIIILAAVIAVTAAAAVISIVIKRKAKTVE